MVSQFLGYKDACRFLSVVGCVDSVSAEKAFTSGSGAECVISVLCVDMRMYRIIASDKMEVVDRMRRIWYVPVIVAVVVAVCFLVRGGDNDVYWQSDVAWYVEADTICDGYADVFYIASTDVMRSYLPDSEVVLTSVLSDGERAAIGAEYAFVHREIFPDSLNFFAPYYHQYTMEAIDSELFDSVFAIVSTEVCESFDYYMTHLNGGRRFILAGFSQGAQMVKVLLKHMTDEQYSRMAVAYVLGFGVNEGDLECAHIVPAMSAFDRGVTVSFNTVSDTSAIWPFVYDSSVICINPVNWSTSFDTASFVYKGHDVSVSVDSAASVLVADGFCEEPLSFVAPWPNGCLHHYDLLFYTPMLRRNALDRVR